MYINKIIVHVCKLGNLKFTCQVFVKSFLVFIVDAREAVKGLIEIDSNLRLLKNEEISDRFYEVSLKKNSILVLSCLNKICLLHHIIFVNMSEFNFVIVHLAGVS